MSTFRIHKRKSYLICDKGFLDRKDLSMRSKGILAYLLSKPDDWVVYMNNIISCCTEGREAIRTSIQELIDFGYLVRNEFRDQFGRINYEYSVYEFPVNESRIQEAGDGKPSTVTNPLLIKEEVSNELLNTEEAAKADGFADELKNEWNKYSGLPTFIRLTTKRLQSLRTRMKDSFFSENWKEALAFMGTTPFYYGENDRGWRANVDYFLRPDTVIKLMERKSLPKQMKPKQQSYSRPEHREMPTAN